MKLFGKVWKFRSSVTSTRVSEDESQIVTKEEEIISKLDPWGLACAVGAMNGSIYGEIGSRGTLNFDGWFRLVQKQDWKSATGATEVELYDAVRSYAQKNRGKHLEQVLQEEQAKRGIQQPGIVLGPGRSIIIEIPFTLKKP